MKKILLILILATAFTQNVFAKNLKLSLNWKPEPEFGGFYSAQIEGIFKKSGLNVEIIPGGSGTPNIQMLAANQVDFAIVNGDDILISRERGMDITPLFAVYQTNPHAIMVHKEKNFKNLGEVLASKGTLAAQVGMPYLAFLKNKYKTFNVKIVPFPGGITNFLHDKNFYQQCFITSEPLAAEKAGAKVETFVVAAEGFNPYETVLAVRAKFKNENPELVKKMVSAVREGWQSYLKDSEKTNVFMNKLNPSIDLETFRKISEVQKSFIETTDTKKYGLGYMSKERWATLADQLKLKLPDDFK